VLDTPASFGLDVPDDAGFARNSPRMLADARTLGLSSGPPGRSPGASLRSERPGRCAPIRWPMADFSWERRLTKLTGSLRSHHQPW